MGRKPLHVTLLITLAVGLSAELVVFGSSASAPADATMLLGSIGAVVLMGTLAALMVAADAPRAHPATTTTPPGRPLPDYQLRALDDLCRLPQFRRLDETSALDYRSGTQISLCNCNEYKEPHLAVHLAGQPLFGLVTPESVSQYLAVQGALAPMAPAAGEVR